MLGDSFSDDGHGANPVVQDALSQKGVSVGTYQQLQRVHGKILQVALAPHHVSRPATNCLFLAVYCCTVRCWHIPLGSVL